MLRYDPQQAMEAIVTEVRPAEDVTSMIQYCEEHESKMTNWERNFIDSIQDQFGRGNSLSGKQVVTLNKIWSKVGG
jgi:hypothetical protein